jgi:hypothetical protein
MIKPLDQVSSESCDGCKAIRARLNYVNALCDLHHIAKHLALYNKRTNSNIFLAHYVKDPPQESLRDLMERG